MDLVALFKIWLRDSEQAGLLIGSYSANYNGEVRTSNGHEVVAGRQLRDNVRTCVEAKWIDVPFFQFMYLPRWERVKHQLGTHVKIYGWSRKKKFSSSLSHSICSLNSVADLDQTLGSTSPTLHRASLCKLSCWPVLLRV